MVSRLATETIATLCPADGVPKPPPCSAVPLEKSPALTLPPATDTIAAAAGSPARPRALFATLDGMRGVAALAVALYHGEQWFRPFGVHPAGAFVAVDLFFCLSGFVIAHAYGRRLDAGLSPARFMTLRLLRLYPLFFLALSIQILLYGFSMVSGSTSPAELAAVIGPALVFLPTPWNVALFPANGPAWSLFFELVINLVAVLLWRWMSAGLMVTLAIAGGLALLLLALAADSVDGGYFWSGFGLGLARVTFSFFVGCLIYETRLHERLPRLPASLLILVVAALLWFAADFGVAGELAVVLLAFPALVALGAATEPAWRAPSLLAGRLSYAVYVLHMPFYILLANVVVKSSVGLPPWLAALFALPLLLAGSWIADRWYDAPVRRFLQRGRARAAAA